MRNLAQVGGAPDMAGEICPRIWLLEVQKSRPAALITFTNVEGAERGPGE